MVLSKINKSISYPEIKNIDLNDIDKEANIYEIELFDTNILIAVGNGNVKKEYKSIMYFPIYFIKKNKKSFQIGVYEIETKDLTTFIDEDGNLKVEDMDEPLIYSFVKKDFIENNRLVYDDEKQASSKNKNEEEEEKSLVILPEKRKDIFKILPDFPVINKLIEETEIEAKDITEKYHLKDEDEWIQKFMKNRNYSIRDNEAGGDCFFAIIRDAFLSIGQETTVSKLRDKLSNNATEEIFNEYKENYNMYRSAIEKDSENLLQIKKELEEIKKKLQKTISVNEKEELKQYDKQLRARFAKIKGEQDVSKEDLKAFKFMKNVDNLEDFKKKVRHCDFWADAWAITILETILNIKFIILSSESYENNDSINILRCGYNNIKPENNVNIDFNPEFYIMAEHTGNHYKLIGYKNKEIFTYEEIPFYIKKMIVDKCMETNGGIFNIIPQFKQLQKRMIYGYNKKSSSNKLIDDDIVLDDNEKISEKISKAEIQNLFDGSIVFVIHPKIGKNLEPGKANGDVLEASKKRDFVDLKNTPEWRKKLDNSWKQEFLLDDHKWISVETYVQASRYKINNREFYLQFSLDSDTKMSRDPDLAKTVSESKTGLIKGEQLRPKKVKPDPDFETRKNKEQYDAIFAKFNQNPDLKKVLLDTKNAKLIFHVKGDTPIDCDNLMIVRSLL